MQWNENLKIFLRSKKITQDEIAVLLGMTRVGLYNALKYGTLKFESMVIILTKYNIDYYSLIGMENPFLYEIDSNSDVSCANMNDINSLLKNTKENFELKIELYKDQIKLLKDQNKFMQDVISKTLPKN